MHSIDVLEEAIELAESSGFEVRREFLGESTGGACRIAGQWLLFVDLSLPTGEQLLQVVSGLRSSGVVTPRASSSAALRSLLG
ncbi:MAG: hypothetical protein R3C56_23490 [Pirellulaceae bacterium]